MLQTGKAIPQWKGHLGARRVLLLIWAAVLLLGGASAATAKCFPMVQSTPRIMPASLPATGSVRITFLGHSSFWIETPGGVSAVTDYNGYLRPPTTPDIVTMNNAHDTHYTDFPDPDIGLVLRGWGAARRGGDPCPHGEGHGGVECSYEPDPVGQG